MAATICGISRPRPTKVLVKNSDGVTQYTRDDIDPSVPLGTGVLAIANGGTGADNAAAALANLGAVDQGTVTDLASQVASLAGLWVALSAPILRQAPAISDQTIRSSVTSAPTSIWKSRRHGTSRPVRGSGLLSKAG